jgi:hypothetical protein
MAAALPRDKERGFKLLLELRKHVSDYRPEGLYDLALCFENGWGTEKDPDLAFLLYKEYVFENHRVPQLAPQGLGPEGLRKDAEVGPQAKGLRKIQARTYSPLRRQEKLFGLESKFEAYTRNSQLK